MSTDAAPLARFSRIGFGLGLKTPAATWKSKKKTGADNEDWYIPYNGPYEAPREPPRRRKERDSWGDPVDSDGREEDSDAVLDDGELHKRYGYDFPRRSGERRSGDEPERRGRDRTQSVVSGRTMSSGNIDPARTSFATLRRSTVSSATRPPVPSFINLDAAGSSVGESPMPPPRASEHAVNRMSFASIFGLGPTRTKTPSSSSYSGADRSLSHKRSRPGRLNALEERSRTESPASRPSFSSSKQPSLRERRSQPLLNSVATSDEEYYNSYYTTLIPTPNQDPYASQPTTASTTNSQQHARRRHPPQNNKTITNALTGRDSVSPTSPSHQSHPYAYAFPQRDPPSDVPHTAPLLRTPLDPGPSNQHQRYRLPQPQQPRLTFTQPPNPHHRQQTAHPSSADTANFSLPTSLKAQLKSSVSTPDLRLRAVATATTRPPVSPQVPKGKERWLSAETWCDALLFPRPRLKIKQPGALREKERGGSGRIVSPPGTPLGQDGFNLHGTQEPGIASRVLAYSRSLVDLRQAARGDEKRVLGDEVGELRRKDPGRERERSRSRTRPPPPPPKEVEKGKEKEKEGQTLRPPRPQSWALDDLALPSPAPSLSRVLEEGLQLENQRRQWQAQATGSLGNKAARSVSRARSKSLTAKGRKTAHIPQTNIDFLAARACLGNQDVLPFLSPIIQPDRSTGYSSTDPNTNTTYSHSHSNSHSHSLVKTLTKSSKSHSRGHSRSDSWSKSALKMAKNTVLCGLNSDGADLSPVLDVEGLEGALRRDGTRVIRLADPAQIPVDKGLPIAPLGGTPRVSLTPSGYDDVRMGIALSTPPLEDREEIRIAHPYAQGGKFSYTTPVPAESRVERSEYAGPHRSNPAPEKGGEIPDAAARHKLPPHIVLHPYAAQSSQARNSYVPHDKLVHQIRPDSDVPPPAKMWAQLSPGVVREILPADIQYSPFMSENGDVSPEARNSTNITDTMGVAEALAYAIRAREDRDSGLGTSEEQHGLGASQPVWLEQEDGGDTIEEEEGEEEESPVMVQRVHRLTVQYDATRPSYMQANRMPSDPSTNHTIASSPLVTPPQPRVGPFGLQTISPSPADTSASSSSQPSPRPLGSPTDLENFKDLFYKPKLIQKRPSEAEISASLARMPAQTWDIVSHKRTGSGLTSLARQLSEEFEQMSKEQESQYSRDSASASLGRQSLHRRPTDDGLEFVLEEAMRSESPVSAAGYTHTREPLPAFKPSVNIPEDVGSSRVSSPIEKMEEDEDEDATAVFRVGMIESVATPPATYADHRISFMGDMSFVPPDHNRSSEAARTESDARVNSGLQPPLTDATRSSYMTTSTMSRMSGLSDFPAPPKNIATPKHMSLLSSYFDEALNDHEARSGSRSPTPPLPVDDHHMLSSEQEAEELLAALSASRPPSRI